MKLIYAIIHNDDNTSVTNALTKNGFFVTKLASSGGFLKSGNTTIMICTEEEKVDSVFEIIKLFCKQRTQAITTMDTINSNEDMGIPTKTVDVSVGGATIFVVDTERFEKI